jgi:hypothetical protein
MLTSSTHACTNAQPHAQPHARTHARMHASTHTCMHTSTHARTHARTHAHTHARIHARIHARMHARMHEFTFAREKSCKHALTHSTPLHFTSRNQTLRTNQPVTFTLYQLAFYLQFNIPFPNVHSSILDP